MLIFQPYSKDDFVKNPILNKNSLLKYKKAKSIFPNWITAVDDEKLELKQHAIILKFNSNFIFDKAIIQKLIDFLQLLDTVSFFEEDNETMIIYGTVNIYEER